MKQAIAAISGGIVIAGCAGGVPGKEPTRNTDPQLIVGKTWQWESTITPAEKISVPEPERYTILLWTMDGFRRNSTATVAAEAIRLPRASFRWAR